MTEFWTNVAEKAESRGTRNFLTGEDFTILIARGPDYIWEELRLVATMNWQESRVVVPHFGYDDAWFTSASPGVRMTNGAIVFYRKAGDMSPLHFSQKERAAQQGVNLATTKDIIKRRNDFLLNGRTAGDTLSISARSMSREAYEEAIGKERTALAARRSRESSTDSGTSRDAAVSAQRLPGQVISNTYDGGQSRLEEPVDLMIMLAYPKLLDIEERTFFGAIRFRSCYFTGNGSSIQNISVEPSTETIPFICQKITKIDLTH